MAKVLFKRYESNIEAEESQIIDGQFIVTKEGKTFVDYGSDRIPVGGTLDDEMSDSSTNGVENKVIKQYVDKKIDDKTMVLSGDITLTPASAGLYYGYEGTKIISYPDGYNQNNCVVISSMINNQMIPYSDLGTANGSPLAYSTVQLLSNGIYIEKSTNEYGAGQSSITETFKIVLMKTN